MTEEFQAFWDKYPRRVAKAAAIKAFDKAVLEGADPEAIINGARLYAAHVSQNDTPLRYVKIPTTFLNQGCWEDEYELNIPKQSVLSDREALRLARVKAWQKTGVWRDEWGERPIEGRT